MKFGKAEDIKSKVIFNKCKLWNKLEERCTDRETCIFVWLIWCISVPLGPICGKLVCQSLEKDSRCYRFSAVNPFELSRMRWIFTMCFCLENWQFMPVFTLFFSHFPVMSSVLHHWHHDLQHRSWYQSQKGK